MLGPIPPAYSTCCLLSQWRLGSTQKRTVRTITEYLSSLYGRIVYFQCGVRSGVRSGPGSGPGSSGHLIVGSPDNRHSISQFFDVNKADSNLMGRHPASTRLRRVHQRMTMPSTRWLNPFKVLLEIVTSQSTVTRGWYPHRESRITHGARVKDVWHDPAAELYMPTPNRWVAFCCNRKHPGLPSYQN